MNGLEKWMKNGTSMDNGNRKMEVQWIFMDINGNTIAESHEDMMGIKGLSKRWYVWCCCKHC